MFINDKQQTAFIYVAFEPWWQINNMRGNLASLKILSYSPDVITWYQ